MTLRRFGARMIRDRQKEGQAELDDQYGGSSGSRTPEGDHLSEADFDRSVRPTAVGIAAASPGGSRYGGGAERTPRMPSHTPWECRILDYFGDCQRAEEEEEMRRMKERAAQEAHEKRRSVQKTQFERAHKRAEQQMEKLLLRREQLEAKQDFRDQMDLKLEEMAQKEQTELQRKRDEILAERQR